jgi:predicted membrane-bound dolichyl-phosphate-mannose-protein mannosyltransferase
VLTQRVERGRAVLTAILVFLAVVSIYIYASTAYDLYNQEITRGGRGYVSDEVWYVSSSRVILKKIFNLEPKQPSSLYNATLIFTGKPNIFKLNETAVAYGVIINTKLSFSKLNAVYISGDEKSVKSFISSLGGNVTDVIPGWVLPDNEGINNYINWEHPPLGKYLIALVMYTLGDNPLYWRIPVVTAGVLTVIFTFLVAYRLTESTIASLAVSLFTLMDPISRALFSIALLDGYMALFTVIALYYALRGKYRGAVLVSLIGACFKSSMLFTTIPLLVLLARREAVIRGRSVLVFIKSLIRYGAITLLAYLALLALVSIPIISYMDITNWISYGVIGAAEWHASVKCTDPAKCPVSSSPWDWFIGVNSFTLYIYPDGTYLYATGYYPLWSLSLILAVLFTPLVYTRKRLYGHVVLVFLGTLLGYIGLWIIGGRTQYSFYAVHFAPLVYTNLVYVFAKIIPRRELVKETVETWVKLALTIISKLTLL